LAELRFFNSNVNANTQNEEDGPGTPDSLVVFLMTMLTMAQLDDPSPKMDAMCDHDTLALLL